MTRRFTLLAVLTALLTSAAGGAVSGRAPEFTRQAAGDWINTAPLTFADLKGRVVLVEFWTFGCINCRRTLPWLKNMHERYGDQGLVIVGVHSPEFAEERDAGNVRSAVRRLGIEYAVMLDDDFAYWKALENRFWPAFYLVDRDGRIQASEFGELHTGTTRGDDMEKKIRRLLAEKPPT